MAGKLTEAQQAAGILALNNTQDVTIKATDIIAAGNGVQTFDYPVPANRDYRDIQVWLKNGITPTMVKEMSIIPNDGDRLQQYSALHLDLLNQYFQEPASAMGDGSYLLEMRQIVQGVFGGGSFVDFKNSVLFSGSIGDATEGVCLNCNAPDSQGRKVDTLTIRLVIDTGTVAGTLGTINIKAQAMPTYPGGDGFGLVKWVRMKELNLAVGSNTIDKQSGLKFGDNQNQYLEALVLIPDAGTLDNFQLDFNGTTIRNRTAQEIIRIQNQNLRRTPQAGMYVLDWTEYGFGDKMLPIGDPNSTYELRLNSSAGGRCVMYQMVLGNFWL